MSKTFDCVIAKPWYPEDPNSAICSYKYFDEVHQNVTKEEAKEHLEYVRRVHKGEADQWNIYKVKFKKV